MSDEPIGVHPVADLFPMLSDDELADLAADIKANGLNHPITLDRDGRIVDGRNRHAACLLANVDPEFVVLDHGVDPVAFILSENIARRHLSKGQQAILVLRARLRDSRRGSQEATAAGLGISQDRMSAAQVILDWAAEQADEILSGSRKFDDVLSEARNRRAAASSADAQLKRLRRDAPDLAALVVDEQMTLAEALGALKVRQQQERERRRATSQLADTMLTFLDPGEAATSHERARQILETLDREAIPTRPDFSARRVRRCAATLSQLADLIAQQEEHHVTDAVPVE